VFKYSYYKFIIIAIPLSRNIDMKKNTRHVLVKLGGSAKIVQDMTLTNTPGTNLPRVVSTRGKAYPG
jgi:hypothetical protein